MAIFSHRGIHYHIAEWGDRRNPPLILLHGFSESSATWSDIAPRLAENRFVIAPDLIGHGKSDRSNEPASFEMAALLGWLSALLRWLWVDCADFVGYSMGGRIALMYACTQPHRVSSLVLESTGLGPRTEPQHQAMLKRDLDTISFLMQSDSEQFADFWESQALFETQKQLPEEVRAKIRAMRVANDPHALALMIRGTGHHTMPDLSQKITSLPMKILYIAGILDRRYLKIAETLQRKRGISALLLNTGHNAHLEAPEPYIGQVKKFLESSPLHEYRLK
ncbi:MAG: alpha/beta fold hydrolase [Eggerthellaceae bacterium]|jgi:2-succinyl-6-hydroxy-2,4-cyclohexadiene-1-carboxylate synthase|nr:alpha/beta fold hydrolase [Eggerthellaceae bacterium]MDR2721977.1 alpha/beta fold hydrolase [Coriobacteriaceae bacterium]